MSPTFYYLVWKYENNMKQKISISLDEMTVKKVEAHIGGIFRSKSHFIEYAVQEQLTRLTEEQQ